MTNDSHLFHKNETPNRLPLYEGKMIHQFTHQWNEPKYWIDESEARKILLKKQEDTLQVLPYQRHRLAFREIARSSDIRSLIATILPKLVFANHKLMLSDLTRSILLQTEIVYICGLLNSFIFDFLLRQRVTTSISMFLFYQLPVPRVSEGNPYFSAIAERTAKLICTTPEFDDLAAEVGLGSHTNGVTDEAERAQLRAELDGMIAHLYGLTEAEFTHILSTFPIVPEETKQAALEEYRKFAPLAGDPEIIDLIAQGESNQLEFKSTARWDLKENTKSKVMEEVILKTVAAFLNTNGGTLLIGVADDGTVLGLQPDYQTLKKKDRDGYQLWLMNDLLLKEFGKAQPPFSPFASA